MTDRRKPVKHHIVLYFLTLNFISFMHLIKSSRLSECLLSHKDHETECGKF